MLRRRTRLAIAAAAVLVLLALLLLRDGLAWGVELGLRAELHRRGVHEVAIRALDVGATGARIDGLDLDGGSLVVERIEIGYTVRELLRGRVGAVRIRGARAQGRLGEEPSLGALGALAAGLGGGSAGGGPPRFRELAIEDARLELATPRGVIAIPADASFRSDGGALLGSSHFRVESERENVRGAGRLELTAEGAVVEADLAGEALRLASSELRAFSASLRARGSPAALAGELAVELEAVLAPGQRAALSLPARVETEWTAQHGLRVRATSAEGTLRFPDAGLAAAGIEVELASRPAAGEPAPPLEARLRIRELRDLREPARIAPAALSVELRTGGERVEADARLEGAGGRLVLRATGFHDPATRAGEARVALEPLQLGPGVPTLRDLVPALGRAVQQASGHVEASGTLAWRGTELSSDLELALRDFSAQGELGELDGLETSIRILRPWPLRTARDQRLRVARSSVGLPLEEASVRFHADAGRVEVASAEARLLGGRLHTQGTWDPALEEQRFTLDVAGVDLTLLAAHLELDGLTATGALGGSLPIVVREAGVFAEAGRLEASAPGGVIHYQPASAPALPAGVRGTNMMLAALRDFRYQELHMQLDGALAGDLHVGLHLRGSNPGFYEGRAVEFNLNLEAPLAAIVRGSRVGMDLPERIRRSLEERAP